MKIGIIFFLLFYYGELLAANSIDLFDQNRSQQSSLEETDKVPKKRSYKRPSRINFKLSGITRIGDEYVLYFETSKGQRDRFVWNNEQAITIYDDYEITEIIDRSLYLNSLNNNSCSESESKGITCDEETNQMIMHIVRKKTDSDD